MKTVITINVVEWVLYLVVIWLALSLADSTLAIYKRYLEWRIKKIKKPKQMNEEEIKLKCKTHNISSNGNFTFYGDLIKTKNK